MEKFLSPSSNRDHEGYSESLSKVMKRYFVKLNLNKDDLLHKSILDIGAGSGKFINALKAESVTDTCVSLDIHYPEKSNDINNESSYVVASGHMLPFPDNTFDYITSVSSIPNVIGIHIPLGTPSGEFKNGIPIVKVSKEDMIEHDAKEKIVVTQIVKECLRVIKVDGEIRFGGMSKLRNLVIEGMNDALFGVGEIKKEITSEGSELFILRKLS